jgi:tetratricopeptide (TPR) repeat protein/serine/threonine protein kinase
MTLDPQPAKSIFLAALDRPHEERATFLDAACAGDPELRRRVDRLLEAHDRPDSLPEAPAAPTPTEASSPPVGPDPGLVASAEGPGAVLGPYKLVERIGEGGMGTVYLAQQAAPVKRLVALKVIKPGMDSQQVLARFEAERQALALMEHPNIARVLDADTADSGRPYFVMELVKGVPITRYCDEHRLTPRQRLELFAPVCQAIQHAHQKSIIHRDIKPSNILVAQYDGKPVPKVIDFGVAKAMGQQLTEQTLVTGFGSIVGTLEYMSPEQAEVNQLDIDTRSDIYSLGVLLYELLTGSPPFTKKDLEKAGMLEMLRVIREQEPSKPSTKLSSSDALPTLSANRGTEPAKLTRLVRGELDWIVMKALEKDRNRRYESANGFAQDIQRYLADEPVQACPPSARYRLRKFVRRNKGRLAAVAGVFLAVTLMAATVGWAVRDRAARAAEIERVEIARLDAVAGQVRDSLNAARTLIAENKLAAARQKLAEALAQLGNDRSALGKLAAEVEAGAAELDRLQQFLDLIDRAHQAEAAPVLDAEQAAHRSPRRAATGPPARIGDRRPAAAVPFLLAALERYEVLERDNWTARLEGGLLGKEQVEHVRRRAYEELLWLAEDAALRQEEHRSGQKLSPASAAQAALVYLGKAETAHRPTRAFYSMRAYCRKALGEVAAARVDLQRADQTRPTMALDFYLQGVFAHGRKQQAEAVRAFEAALRLEPSHYWSLMRLGICLCDLGQGPEDFLGAARVFTGCILKRPDHAHAYFCRAIAYCKLGRNEEAVADASRAIELDPMHETAWLIRGAAYRRVGQPARAVADFSRAIQLNPKEAQVWAVRGNAYHDLGQLAKAVADCSRAIELNPKYATAWYRRGFTYHVMGQQEKAIADYSKAIELSPEYAAAWADRGNAYSELGQPAKAVADCSRAVELDPKLAPAWYTRGVVYMELQQPDKAIGDFSRAIEANPKYAVAWINRGAVHRRLGQLDKAIADLTCAIELDPKIVAAWYSRGIAYFQTGQWDKVVADCSRAIQLDARHAEAWANRGCAYHKLGLADKAIADFSRAIELKPKLVLAWYTRGRVFLELGQVDRAIADCARAVELDPKDAVAHNNLGLALRESGDLSAARTALQKAVALWPEFAEAHCNLGEVLRRLGEFRQALAALRRGHEIGSKRPDWKYSSLQWVRQCERLIELDKQLPHFLDGKALPADVTERIELAELCCFKRLYRAAVRFYEEAFPRQPKFVPGDHYNAARAAAQAGSGQGKDAANLDDGEREHLRSLALNGLTTVLTHFAKEAAPAVLQKELRFWQVDPNLASVREPGQLAKLPPKEREAWRQLWMEVAEGLKGDLSVYRLAVRLDPAWVQGHYRLANALRIKGDQVGAIAALQKAHALAPKDHFVSIVLAWLLAICPDPKVRDTKQAVALARMAIDAAPNEPYYWRTLGVAHYYAGDHQAALEALTREMQLTKNPEAFDYFPLAMAHQQLGHKEEARKWYDLGVAWAADQKQHPSVAELALLHADAEALLGIPKPAPDKSSQKKK